MRVFTYGVYLRLSTIRRRNILLLVSEKEAVSIKNENSEAVAMSNIVVDSKMRSITLKSDFRKKLWKQKYLLILLVPAALYYIFFKFLPMYGVILAFKEFNFIKGIWASPWIGLENFSDVVKLDDFWRSVKNTVVIAGLRLIFEFPAPIILAILINEIRHKKFKKGIQTIFTFPHFLSWIIISGMLTNLFGDSGSLNRILIYFGFEKSNVLVDPGTFRMFLVISNIWKEAGWGTIIYLAALSGIDPAQYEAASIDGANRWHKIKYIDWPGIRPTAVILLILFLGSVMSSGGGGFEQIFNLYNPAVYPTGDILDTYIYRRTFSLGQSYGSSTAIGLFKSVVNMILIFSANKLANKISDGEGGLF